MNLPNASNALVHPSKITKYLLNLTSEKGGPKAKFFMRFGFTLENPDLLAEALKEHAVTQQIEKIIPFDWGMKYILRCRCKTPDHRNPSVISVWNIPTGETVPRLVSAYRSKKTVPLCLSA